MEEIIMKKVFIALDILSIILSIVTIFYILSNWSDNKSVTNIQEG